MLHLPMEPVEYPEINPGPGTLLAAMPPDELLRVLEEDLRAVPHIRGVNNHMGSRLTARSEQLYQVFSVLKRRGLYFVDSRTTDETVCRPSARLFELPFAQRDVFLDHVHEPAAIRRQLRELVRIARLKGEAVAIGHPHPTTLAVLREEAPRAAPAGRDRPRLAPRAPRRVEPFLSRRDRGRMLKHRPDREASHA
ncbi:MAG: divergent polysaccharide deacetylase family protein [Desulfobacterales bacterium]|nr:divergent polysaccharide deacetylase family protein [Desulfobacterales bacterium]